MFQIPKIKIRQFVELCKLWSEINYINYDIFQISLIFNPLYYLFPAKGQANCPNDNRPNRIQNHSGRGGLSFGNW